VDMQSTIVTSDKLGNGLRAIFLMVCPWFQLDLLLLYSFIGFIV
jgi:hypothetical protein